jgi:hypothetical protein
MCVNHTVLHDIADDAEFVEIAATALGAKRLFKGNLWKAISGVLVY